MEYDANDSDSSSSLLEEVTELAAVLFSLNQTVPNIDTLHSSLKLFEEWMKCQDVQ
jgi:hypothetical protein